MKVEVDAFQRKGTLSKDHLPFPWNSVICESVAALSGEDSFWICRKVAMLFENWESGTGNPGHGT